MMSGENIFPTFFLFILVAALFCRSLKKITFHFSCSLSIKGLELTNYRKKKQKKRFYFPSFANIFPETLVIHLKVNFLVKC